MSQKSLGINDFWHLSLTVVPSSGAWAFWDLVLIDTSDFSSTFQAWLGFNVKWEDNKPQVLTHAFLQGPPFPLFGPVTGLKCAQSNYGFGGWIMNTGRETVVLWWSHHHQPCRGPCAHQQGFFVSLVGKWRSPEMGANQGLTWRLDATCSRRRSWKIFVGEKLPINPVIGREN